MLNSKEQLISKMSLEEKAGQLTILADTIRPCNPDINPEAVDLPCTIFSSRQSMIKDCFACLEVFSSGGKVNHRQADEMVEQVRCSRVGSIFNGVGVKDLKP